MSPSWQAPILVFWTALAASVSPAAPAQDIRSDVSRQGEFISVSAVVDLPVDRRVAWGVLTDYDNLAGFIPDMDYSRVISRQPGGGLMLSQKGSFGFLFFHYDLEVRLAVIESAPDSVVSRLVSGNMRDMSGRYDLSETPGGVRLAYRGRILPETALPPLIGPALVRHAVNRQFAAMVREILRRDALARASAPVPAVPKPKPGRSLP